MGDVNSKIVKPDQFKCFLPKKNISWYKAIHDKNISQNKKFLLNGLRYVYVSQMMNSLEKKIGTCCSTVYPTGSSNLGSDIDIQVVFDISRDNSLEFYTRAVDLIQEEIAIAEDEWGGDLNRKLDVNFYPGSLFHFMSKRIQCNNNFLVETNSTDKKKVKICFIPRYETPELREQFIFHDCKAISKKITPTTQKSLNTFYNNYKTLTAKCLYKLIKNCKTPSLTPVQHNQLILCLNKLANIGPEMYLSVGSVIFVVWHMQMKNKLPSKLASLLSISAYMENHQLYKQTGKQKYKIRSDVASKVMDQVLYLKIKAQLR